MTVYPEKSFNLFIVSEEQFFKASLSKHTYQDNVARRMNAKKFRENIVLSAVYKLLPIWIRSVDLKFSVQILRSTTLSLTQCNSNTIEGPAPLFRFVRYKQTQDNRGISGCIGA